MLTIFKLKLKSDVKWMCICLFKLMSLVPQDPQEQACGGGTCDKGL